MIEKREILESYVANQSTMAILPYYVDDKLFTKIIEEEREFIVSRRPIDIINYSCKYYGGSYNGQKEGTKTLINITHKSPIAVEPHNMIFFFPTASPSKSHCAWISYVYVLSQKSAENGKTNVVFTNRKTIELEISINSFEMQLYRTAHLCVSLERRLGSMNRTMNFMITPKQKEGILFQDFIMLERDKNRR